MRDDPARSSCLKFVCKEMCASEVIVRRGRTNDWPGSTVIATAVAPRASSIGMHRAQHGRATWRAIEGNQPAPEVFLPLRHHERGHPAAARHRVGQVLARDEYPREDDQVGLHAFRESRNLYAGDAPSRPDVIGQRELAEAGVRRSGQRTGNPQRTAGLGIGRHRNDDVTREGMCDPVWRRW